VFVNHGDGDACEAFRELLAGEGYTAEAPYSGSEYDLLTCATTQYAEGVRIVKMPQTPAGARTQAVYDELVKAAQELLRIAKDRKGCANKENSKFTDQIKSLISKYRR